MGQTLCVCMTPLHVLMVEAIAKAEGQVFDMGLYLTAADGPKSQHYFDRMTRVCQKSKFVLHQIDGNYKAIKHLDIWLRRRRFIKQIQALGQFDRVLLPASLSHYAYAVPSAVKALRIDTFDDGIVNILPDSDLLTRDRSLSFKLFLRLSGIAYWPSRVMAESAVHYTIYPVANVFQRTKLVQLGGDLVAPVIGQAARVMQPDADEPIRVLFGPPPEAAKEVLATLESAAVSIGFHGVLPHPRWDGYTAGTASKIETNLIAEDYIMSLASQHQAGVEVYGYDTTALINTAKMPRVRAFTLLPNLEKYRPLLLLMTECGVGALED